MIKFRNASHSDIAFLVEAIISAEKSGTEVLGIANSLGLKHEEFSHYLTQILEEDIDGCEYSVSSFIIAEEDGKCVGAFAGWKESEEEPSAMLKANLIGYTVPKESLLELSKYKSLLSDIQFSKTPGTYYLEYAHVKNDYRGRGIMKKIIEKHIERALKLNSRSIQVQLFEENLPAFSLYSKLGFKIVNKKESIDVSILKILPYKSKVLMELNLTQNG